MDKIFFYDLGIRNLLINNFNLMNTRNDTGQLWENLIITQRKIYCSYNQIISSCYFWRTYTGAELDLLVFTKGRRYGFEIKYADAPTMTKSIRIAMNDLNLHELFIVYPGKDAYSLDKNIQVIPLKKVGSVCSICQEAS